MPSLSDHIDRLTQTARVIRTSAADTAASPHSPFSEAVLITPLGDLIRDIDPSELGLFTLVTPDEPTPTAPTEVTRIEVVSATPLRKHPARRDDAILRPREPEPEVYAEAAIKYLDRYATVRPMPRARSQAVAMLEQLQQIRENMRALNQTLQQSQPIEPESRPHTPKSLANAEEQRIEELQARIEQLQKRKSSSQRKRPVGKPRPPERPTVASPATPIDRQEATFWNTPGAPARTLEFKSDLLVDEELELGDVTASFDSPVATFRTAVSRSSIAGEDDGREQSADEANVEGDDTVGAQNLGEDSFQDDQTVDGDDDDEGEPTVMLKKVPLVAPEPPDVSTVEIEPPAKPHLNNTGSPPSSAKTQKVRITSDVERIIAKIWTTVGDIIMPGHPFDVSGKGPNKPPRAKETIAHLHTLSAQTPAPSSPTTSSISGTVPPSVPGTYTTQQILTAHMLLALLAAPPNFALPLNRLKEAIGLKAGVGASVAVGAGQVPTRVLYGCVAKRLVRIDRGGGEQVVRFDA
ncbi:hypothetical protein FA95DRAFT_1602923 [Auriscalpium vulgare]|uniref:Uncharacterized protein n=1 Tax=Auriscalpium vulgare TaxID=40419 RepID=A0ACB8S544_9AGAM|nr:hypothetical protein FA95DRAFT_1602923 [Auriscalpium vulgare]